MFYLFVIFHPTGEFFTHLETSPLKVKGCKFFDLCSALIAILQWGFFSMPHLLWHGASIYYGHLWHSHLFLIVWQWSCNCLFLRLRSVVSEIRTPNLARRTLQPTAPPLQYIFEGAINFKQSLSEQHKIGWLNGLCFMLYRQYFSHVTAGAEEVNTTHLLQLFQVVSPKKYN